jgi:hypothetical protein
MPFGEVFSHIVEAVQVVDMHEDISECSHIEQLVHGKGDHNFLIFVPKLHFDDPVLEWLSIQVTCLLIEKLGVVCKEDHFG